MTEVAIMGTRSGKTALTIADAYKIGFEDGLNAGRNKPEAYWIKKKVDKRHYHSTWKMNRS